MTTAEAERVKKQKLDAQPIPTPLMTDTVDVDKAALTTNTGQDPHMSVRAVSKNGVQLAIPTTKTRLDPPQLVSALSKNVVEPATPL